MKKIITCLLICIMIGAVCSGCGTSASATPTEDIYVKMTPVPTLPPMVYMQTNDGWKYCIENGKVVIYGYEGESTEVEIPSQIDGKTVAALDSMALCKFSRVIAGDARYTCDLTKVTIPASIKSIPMDLFAYGDNISNVVFEQGSDFVYVNNVLYSSDMSILYLCTSKNIETFTIPESVKTIAGGAFRACRKLTSITIPSNVEVIGEYAFYNCSALKTVTIKEGVKSINNQAFTRCINLEQITIPKSVTLMAYQTLSYTDKIKIRIHKDSYVDTFFKDNNETYSEGSTYLEHVEYID